MSHKELSPIWMALTNALLPGLAYLQLRQYVRFFVLYIAIITLAIVPVPVLTTPMYPVPPLVLVAIAIDAFFLTNSYNKTGTRPTYYRALDIIGFLTIFSFIAFLIVLMVRAEMQNAEAPEEIFIQETIELLERNSDPSRNR